MTKHPLLYRMSQAIMFARSDTRDSGMISEAYCKIKELESETKRLHRQVKIQQEQLDEVLPHVTCVCGEYIWHYDRNTNHEHVSQFKYHEVSDDQFEDIYL